MKKIEIKAKSGVLKKYHLFNSPEALYVWRDLNLSFDQFIAENADQLTTTEISGDVDQWIEAEWMGFEVHDKTFMIYVRMARITTKPTGEGATLSVYAGWTTSSALKFEDHEDDTVTIKRIDTTGKIDMSSVFGSEQ